MSQAELETLEFQNSIARRVWKPRRLLVVSREAFRDQHGGDAGGVDHCSLSQFGTCL